MYPIKSVYIWNGELCESDEITLVMKVSAAGLAQLHARLKQLHPYELMEFIVLDIDHDGSLADYVEFVRRGTRVQANR
jgi:periplasmic divalent cation tolerance protein